MSVGEICWTKTDEAPLLATYSFYPILKAFTKSSGIDVTIRDISLAGRAIACFPEDLSEEQRIPDELAYLGEWAKTPSANIIKLPNISASIPQLKECIAELQAKGYKLPNYPEDPKTEEERAIQSKYAKVLGSAVNPVLREGNSDRRAAEAVKKYAQKFPHKMGPWDPNSKTHVSSMTGGDFYSSEESVIMSAPDSLRIEHVGTDGTVTVLKDRLSMTEGEVLDASRMSVKQLRAFYAQEIADAKEKDLLLSLHLKATMMKVSDPILFGHCVSVYFADLFEKHASTLAEIGVNPNFGFADVLRKIGQLPEEKRKELEAEIEACYQKNPKLAMVDSNRGITNLHVPSDIIIDASMPSMIRGMDGLGGGMWCPDSAPGAKDSHLCDTKALIPDRSYAGVFREAVNFCKENGAFDPSTMGSVPNVGLMAIKAEEYGSHDKTFEVKTDGKIRIVRSDGETAIQHDVEAGDVWRACQTKDIAIRDWVKLAVTRGRASGWQVLFWLDPARAHDRNIIALAEKYLKDHDTSGLEIKFMAPSEACRYSLERAKAGENTISVTGNVLRDYNTDLFPILELGTSAKMLSIVPLIAGGGMYETGAGGSAPKHVQQFQKESHLRWDSLGEFLAFACSLEDIGMKTGNTKVQAMADALNKANSKFLDTNKSPSRKVNEIDNRGSHFYVALYWAQYLAESSDPELKAQFEPVAAALSSNEEQIAQELITCQGVPADLGGYYMPNDDMASKLMRPSAKLNEIVDSMN